VTNGLVVYCRDCTIQEASGGVIVTNKSYATIDKCVIKNSYMIGLLQHTGIVSGIDE